LFFLPYCLNRLISIGAEVVKKNNIMRNLTETQKELLSKINECKPLNGIFELGNMKEQTKKTCKSFDNSFNALLHKGHIKHFASDRNTFITTKK